MQLIKNNIIPVLIIFAAGFAVVFAFWPLENTDWAEGFRSGITEAGEGESSESEEPFGEEGRLTGIAVLAPMIKVLIFMGVGALLTSLGRKIGSLFMRRTNSSTNTA